MLTGPATVTESPLVILKVAEHEFCLPQSSVALKLTVTLPPAHKFGAVKFDNPEVTNAPFPPEAVNPDTHKLNAVFKAAWSA